jgi:hypothetical protein
MFVYLGPRFIALNFEARGEICFLSLYVATGRRLVSRGRHAKHAERDGTAETSTSTPFWKNLSPIHGPSIAHQSNHYHPALRDSLLSRNVTKRNGYDLLSRDSVAFCSRTLIQNPANVHVYGSTHAPAGTIRADALLCLYLIRRRNPLAVVRGSLGKATQKTRKLFGIGPFT